MRVRFCAGAIVALLLLIQPAASATTRGPASADSYRTLVADLSHAGQVLSAQPLTADNGLEVPWNGTMWQSMPNLTWAACDVSASVRSVVDLAIGQWHFAETNQGVPIHLSELPCINGNTRAQIRLTQSTATELRSLTGSPDLDVFGLTLARDAQNRICVIEVQGPCESQTARVYLFADNWALTGLADSQSAKTVAHEIGHAVGLAHAHFCNFDSVMAQNCEPILPGLGADDVQSLDALVDSVRAYYRQSPLRATPVDGPATGNGKKVTYKAGWNLVAGPRGTDFSAAAGPLYSMVSGDSSYRNQTATQASYDSFGYWAYFPQDVTVQLNGTGGTFYTALATPGRWFLVGNENGTAPMRVVSGAEAVYAYDPQTGQYTPSATIDPGQAAWVKPDRSGLIAVASTSLSRAQVRCYLNLGSPSSC